MTRRDVTNMADSVHRRLLNLARSSGQTFNELAQWFAIERFLFRLSESPYADRFILKGALMLATWNLPMRRTTKDIDLLGFVENDVSRIENVVRTACVQAVPPDGLVFDPESVTGERIVHDAEYKGVRVRFKGRLGNGRLSMQIEYRVRRNPSPCVAFQ